MRWSNPSFVDGRVRIVRPLLQVPREAIGEYAKAWRLKHREDLTNRSVDALRNRIRHRLIPELTANYQPGLLRVLLRQAELQTAESEFIASEAERWLETQKAKFADLAVAVQRRVLVEQLWRLGGVVTYEVIESLRIQPGIPVWIDARSGWIRSRLGVLSRLERKVKERALPEPAEGDAGPEVEHLLRGKRGTIVTAGYSIVWRRRSGRRPKILPRQAGREWFDAGRVGERVILRTAVSSDKFQPFGMPTACQLTGLLAKAKIPLKERGNRLIGSDESGRIWWVDGLRIGAGFEVRPDTREFLEWKWSRK